LEADKLPLPLLLGDADCEDDGLVDSEVLALALRDKDELALAEDERELLPELLKLAEREDVALMLRDAEVEEDTLPLSLELCEADREDDGPVDSELLALELRDEERLALADEERELLPEPLTLDDKDDDALLLRDAEKEALDDSLRLVLNDAEVEEDKLFDEEREGVVE
jgi:hypothetical protein